MPPTQPANAALELPTRLGSLMASPLPVLPGNTSLVEAVKTIERTEAGVVACLSPGQPAKVLTRAHCSELLMASLQGFPIAQTLIDAARSVDVELDKDLPVKQALAQINQDMDCLIGVYQGPKLVGFIGREQWSNLLFESQDTNADPDPFEDPESLLDPLTGLPDHRAYRLHLEMRSFEHCELNIPAVLALIEMDWLEGLVLQHSPEQEQQCIRNVTAALQQQLREPDTLFALEPGKWALLMSGVSPAVGRGISQRLVEAVWASNLPNHGSPLARASISIGLAPPSNDADSTESDADEALEQSIMGGGNQVRLIGERLV